MPDPTRAPLSRRRFLAALGASAATTASVAAAGGLLAGPLGAQTDDAKVQSSATNAEMDLSVVRPVRRPPRPGARPALTRDQRDDLEHGIRCMCGCTLDVYTCRTTDFSCSVSPAMHQDVQRLVEGGYSADEIIAAFTDVYGEKVLMAPVKQGFNWAGYVTPFVALGAGALVLGTLIRRWGVRAAQVAAATPAAVALPIDATPDELARLDAAVRDEEPR